MKRKIFGSKKSLRIFIISLLFCINLRHSFLLAREAYYGLWDEVTFQAFISKLILHGYGFLFYFCAASAFVFFLVLLFFIGLSKDKRETAFQIAFSICISILIMFASFIVLMLILTVFMFHDGQTVVLSLDGQLGPSVKVFGETLGEVMLYWVLTDNLPFCIAALISGAVAPILRRKHHWTNNISSPHDENNEPHH